jgi:hypothetical protein
VPRSTAQPAAVPVSKAAIPCVFLGVRIYYGEVAWLWLSARESPVTQFNGPCVGQVECTPIVKYEVCKTLGPCIV